MPDEPAHESRRPDPGPAGDEPGRSEIWIRRLQQRPDTDSVWDALHSRYKRRIVIYANYRLGPDLRRQVDPEDIVSEAWGRVLAAWPRFEYRGPDSLFHWLCRQVTRAILDRRRKLERRRARSDDGPAALPPEDLQLPAGGEGPRTMVMRRELRDELTAALESVPELYRSVLIAIHLEGQAPADVAAERGVKVDTIRKQVARGIEHWRRALGGDPLRYV